MNVFSTWLLQDAKKSKDNQDKKNQSNSDEWVNKTNYADSIAEIVFDTKPKKKNIKKTKRGSIRAS